MDVGQVQPGQTVTRTFRQAIIRSIAVAPRTSFDRINPVIDQVYAFEQAVPAFEHLARKGMLCSMPSWFLWLLSWFCCGL